MRSHLIVLDRLRPHELLLLAWGGIFGVAYLEGAPAPGSLATLIPAWEIRIWATTMIASSALGLFGALWPRYPRGAMAAESAGMFLGAGGALLYAGSAFLAVGLHGLLPAGLGSAWAVANLWRARQIAQDMHRRELPHD